MWKDSHLLMTHFPGGALLGALPRGVTSSGKRLVPARLGLAPPLSSMITCTLSTVFPCFMSYDSGSPLVPGIERPWDTPAPNRAPITHRACRGTGQNKPRLYVLLSAQPTFSPSSRPGVRAPSWLDPHSPWRQQCWSPGSWQVLHPLGSPLPPPPALGQGRLVSRRSSYLPPLSGGPLFPRLQTPIVLSPEEGSPWSPMTDPVLEAR